MPDSVPSNGASAEASPPAFAVAQRVRWRPSASLGTGILVSAEGASGDIFIAWPELHRELHANLLPYLFANPVGYDFVLCDHHGKIDWLMWVVDAKGEKVCDAWFGVSPEDGWGWDGLIRFGDADAASPVRQTYQRYSDGTYRRLPSAWRSLDQHDRRDASWRHAIFLNYRRADTRDVVGRAYDRLSSAFGRDAVFKDVDDIPVGVDFGDHIRTVLAKCRYLLAFIGPGWIDARGKDGRRRLDDPKDWVRIEIEAALGIDGIDVIPVLTSGASFPTQNRLPPSLRKLTGLNAATLRPDPDFHRDMDRLIGAMEGRARA